MPTFDPLAVRNVCGSLVVFVGGVVYVIPQLERVARIQGPHMNRRLGFQPIRGHSGVAVGIVVKNE